MRRATHLLLILACLLPLVGRPSSLAGDLNPWMEKVDPWLLQSAAEGETEFLVFLKAQADLSPAVLLTDKNAKGLYVYQTLSELAARTQKALIADLESQGLPYRSFWIANMLLVRGNLSAVQSLAGRAEVAYLYANPQVQGDLPALDPISDLNIPNGVEWNLLKINADQVWDAGYTGQGVVIGGQDTGYDWDHPALIRQYRGWDGDFASHDYNWFDATADASQTPIDPYGPYGHGTHTMGIMVGDDGGSNQVGVAPDAEWIGCRNMDAAGWGSPATYAACYQWFVAPTKVDGSAPRPDLAPDVINNSWACLPSEGCTSTNPNVLLAVTQAVRAAGILTVHSSGNYGPTCGNIYPAALYAESFTVGSTDSSDLIAGSSSRGPATWDGSNRLKPEVSAPGVGIRSSIPGTGYTSMSGTSMAAPHVAGLAALLISAQPALAGQVDQIETYIQQSALPRFTTDTCGGDTPTSHPNHTYGWGRVDAWAAFQSLPQAPHQLSLAVTRSSPAVVPGGWLTYTLTVSHSHPSQPTTNLILTNTLPSQTEFITATLPHSWDGDTLRWDFATLAANSSLSVTLTVRSALTATGTIENDRYGLRSADAVGSISTTPASTLVQFPGISLEPGSTRWVDRGSTLILEHELINSGNYSDTFSLSLTSSQGWTSLEAPIAEIRLAAGERAWLSLVTEVPPDVGSGTLETATLTITSGADPAISAQAVDTIGVYYRFYLALLNKP